METNEDFKYGLNLTARAAISFLKINGIGIVSTVLVTMIAFIVLTSQCFGNGTGPAHANGVSFFMVLFAMRPIGSILTWGIFIGSPILIFTLGNKYLLMKTAHKVISDHGETILFPLVGRIIEEVKKQEPELLKSGADAVKLKLKMLQQIKDSNDNKWTKRLTVYGLKKVSLNDIDWSQENISLTQLLNDKIITSLKEIALPTRTFFWVILGIQWLVLILIGMKVI